MTNWMNRGKHFGGVYLKGQVAGMEGKERRSNPYRGSMSQPGQTYERAWNDGFDSITRASNVGERSTQKA